MYKLSPFSYTFNKSGKSKKIFLETTLSFNKNETVAITGPSGGGKTTLLKILKGIIPEYSSGDLEGEVTFNNAPLNGKNFEDNLNKILYLFQNPFSQLIYPTTEEEFVFSMENFNFSREKMNEEKEKFEKIFSLGNIWGKKTSQLSNGECQKLVLASLLAIGPEVLLLDEPTAFLDTQSRREFYQFLQLIKKDRLLIIVDHHIDEIKPIVSRVLYVSEEGEISEQSRNPEPPRLNPLSLSDLPKLGELSLVADKVSYFYNEELLKSINATFTGGEIVAIRGKNGAGKSTLFKLLSGVLASKFGKVELLAGKKKYSDLKIFSFAGFIFQNPESHFFFDTIEEELRQSFKHVKSPALKEDLLNRFFHGIDLRKSPFLLSEGEKRRLSILMTVFLGKSVLFYDEPTFGQDQKSIAEIRHLMKELKQLGLIQIFISHDEKFIAETADRVLHLSEGVLNEIS